MSTIRSPIDSSAVWRPDELTASAWTFHLGDDERAEIIAATRRARREGYTITTIDRDAFVLETLATRTEPWSAELGTGPGFLLLRGFPVDELMAAGGLDEVALAYVGLGTHLGVPVGQDAQGSILGHVRDEGIERTDPSVRFYRTRQRQDFHTDGADLVGLLCLRRARSGGESRIASSAAIYNELLRRRPDLLEVLYRPFHWDRNDEQEPDEDPFFVLAPFAEVAGSPRLFYIGWYVTDAQRHPEVPRLTQEQREAMELLESIANDPAFHLEMEFRRGDVQLLNNARILHAREAYEDHADPAQRRHLLRLWLRAHRLQSVEAGLRRGIGGPQPH